MRAKSPREGRRRSVAQDEKTRSNRRQGRSVSRSRGTTRESKDKKSHLDDLGKAAKLSAPAGGSMDKATIEASLERLRQLEEENLAFSDKIARVVTESRLYMEASIEDLKMDFNQKISNLSGQLHSVYQEGSIASSSNRKSGRIMGPFNRKLFLPRESLLSKMLDHNDENYKTIFNIALSVLFLWGIWLAMEDYEEIGIPNFELLTWGIFRDLGPFLNNWTVMLVSSFSIVLTAHFAAVSKGFPMFHVLVAVYTCFQLAMFYFSWRVVFCREKRFSLPMSVAFMAEQTRMSMKMHAYFREKVLWSKFGGKFAAKPKSCDSSYGTFFGLPLPQLDYFMEELGKFGFFMFAPTLIYRDSYPRTSRIRWWFVVCRLAEFAGIVYYAFLIFREVLPQFSVNIAKPIDLKTFLRLTFRCMAPGMASMVFTHFLILHVVQNIFAELTRFADRDFYGDWWNCRSFAVYYRKWNGIVHEFIHCYLYSDLVEFLGMSKLSALLASFIISAMVHEFVICTAMGFFLPVLGIMFTGPGLMFILLTRNKTSRIWNMFIWTMLTIGNAWMMVMYNREYFYRIAGPSVMPHSGIPWEQLLGFEDFFIPRTMRLQFPGYFSLK